MSGQQNVLQDLREFTVQIRRAANEQIVGTGVVVSEDGKIATCAHVILKAGVNPKIGKSIPRAWAMLVGGDRSDSAAEIGKAEVGVYFPRHDWVEDQKRRRAVVIACFSEDEDDVALLQLVGGPSLLSMKPAVLGSAKGSEGHSFRSYGYSATDVHPATRAEGKILDTSREPESTLRLEQVQLRSPEIDTGMSGAAVLDENRNLIVGLITSRYYSSTSAVKDNIGYAVDSRVLGFSPFDLVVREAALPLGAAPQPKTDIAAAQKAAVSKSGSVLSGAPSSLEEWVGRKKLLDDISADWVNPDRRVTGLIGFGGEGKSSVVRHWLDTLQADRSQRQPDGVFWWAFYDKPSVDEFFEAAITYLSDHQFDPHKLPSSGARAHFIGAMLSRGRYIFILDGLEMLQHQHGDQYGSFTRSDLREFMELLASSWHNSFGLVTSRAPLFDLEKYTTYIHRDVDRLNPDDGAALLRKLGVNGGDDVLGAVVRKWDGHALTLSLLGTYLSGQYAGDVSRISDLPTPIGSEPRYQRVWRVLRRYDEHLTEAERSFMLLFSVFRIPIGEKAFASVFRAQPEQTRDTIALNSPITALNDADFKEMLDRLVKYRILRYDENTRCFTTHPLIRMHYLDRLQQRDRTGIGEVHADVKDYYLAAAGDVRYFPTLEALKPLIEVVHHACSAKAYDEAWRIFQDRIYQGRLKTLISQLGASNVALELLQEFFPEKDTSKDPLVGDRASKQVVLNEVGLRLVDLGCLQEGLRLHERSASLALDGKDRSFASSVYQDLAELYAYRGELAKSKDAARQALELARAVSDREKERYSLARMAWVAHLQGELAISRGAYHDAEVLERRINPSRRYLFALRGIQYADHLRRTGELTLARQVTNANLSIAEQFKFTRIVSECHRLLGDLDSEISEHLSGERHYDHAIGAARAIARREALIESLLARGRWRSRRGAADAARTDLDEALDYAAMGGYRIYEVDIRIALAWAERASDRMIKARAAAENAQRVSVEMGYYWGHIDAAELLAELQGQQ